MKMKKRLIQISMRVKMGTEINLFNIATLAAHCNLNDSAKITGQARVPEVETGPGASYVVFASPKHENMDLVLNRVLDN